MKSEEQLQRWKNSEPFKVLMRQIHADIFVGSKNGVPEQELKDTLEALTEEIKNSVEWKS